MGTLSKNIKLYCLTSKYYALWKDIILARIAA